MTPGKTETASVQGRSAKLLIGDRFLSDPGCYSRL